MINQATLIEPSREIPIAAEVDVCVVGGGCTGVFAAVRAARLGYKVALIEVLGHFGGAATARMVNVWHSTWNTTGTIQTIAGLSVEAIDRIRRHDAVLDREKTNADWQFCFNSSQLSIELDTMVMEEGIMPFLHARVVAAVRDGDRVDAVIIEDKSGRRAIKAGAFVDSSGDADLYQLATGKGQRHEALQPPTTAAIIDGHNAILEKYPDFKIAHVACDPNNPKALHDGFLWCAPVPGSKNLRQMFGTRVHGVDCSKAEDLTRAEMEGRAQVRRIVGLLREAYPDEGVALAALPACTGIRDSRFGKCDYKLNVDDVLHGKHFDDAIGYGTYRVDIHHQGDGGLTFRYLDGREEIARPNAKREKGRWRDPIDEDPTYYQIPYRSLVAKELDNVLMAGRCIDTDMGAFGAIRVMINCNQMGEAAGVACTQLLEENCSSRAIDVKRLRKTMADGGSIML